jgi:O-antigen/teichoic acid export membrane protein
MISKIKNKAKNWLLWSQKYTKTDMLYLARGGFWLTLGQIISSASSFFLAIAFANLLPKETYGTYKYILSVTSILTIPALSGMGTAITQAVARGYEGSLIPALKTKIRWGLLGGLASLILAGYYYLQGDATLTISFLISAVFLPFMDSFGIYDSLLQGRKLFDVSTQYFIISQIIAASALIAALFLTKNLFLILLAYFASWTLMRFIFLKITLKKFTPNQNQDPKTISYGKHLSLIGVIGTIAAYLDRLLIFHYLGAAQVAIYSIAIAPPEQIKGLFKNVNFLALPKFSQRSKEEIKKTILSKTLQIILITIPVVVVYILLAPFIFKLFFPKYLDAVIFSQIFALSLITAGGIIPYTALQSQTAQKELYLFNFASSIFQIISLFIGVYFFGIMGAIIARIATRFFNLITILYLKNILQ